MKNRATEYRNSTNTQYTGWQYTGENGDLPGMKLREIVARNLRQLRNAKGLSQEELADRADINRNYVGLLEREQHAATVDMLEKLAAVLEVDPIDLLRSKD